MKHEWVVLVAFKLTEGQASAANGGALLTLDIGMTHPDFYGRGGAVNAPVGCYKCERLWSDVHGKPCDGQPAGQLEYVE